MNEREKAARTLAFLFATMRKPQWGRSRQSDWAWKHWRRFLPLVTDDLAGRTEAGKQDLLNAIESMKVVIARLNRKPKSDNQ